MIDQEFIWAPVVNHQQIKIYSNWSRSAQQQNDRHPNVVVNGGAIVSSVDRPFNQTPSPPATKKKSFYFILSYTNILRNFFYE